MTLTLNTGESMSKKAFVARYGAYGDNILITPIIDELKDQGYYIILETSDRGMEVFKHDDRIDELIQHDMDMPIEELGDHLEKMKEKYKPDYFKDFSGSIEQNVAVHPTQPLYSYPKYERAKRCNRNYYRTTTEWGGMVSAGLRPSLRFTEEEEKEVQKYIKKEGFNIQWNLSGSGKNKMYPWTEYVMGEVIKKYPNVNFITTGDERCQLLENIGHQLPNENFTELSGKVGIRTSLLLTKYVDLVISTDTSILHASGCYDTPKIGLLGHSTKENITAHFKNDFSIEAKVDCAPCFYLIYDHQIQCPLQPLTQTPWCLAEGIAPEQVFDNIVKVKEEFYGKED